jgi:uncharacterized integral membrane protein/outer membrane murein-binding lipoprotein Lpp
MRKFSTFLIILLIVLIASLLFVVQNGSKTVELKFLWWVIPNVSVGLSAILVFLAGVVSMWLISLMLYIGSTARYRREIKERDTIIKTLEQEKSSIKSDQEAKIKEYENKVRDLEIKVKSFEEKLKTATATAETAKKEETQVKESLKEAKPEQTSEEEKPKRKGFFRRSK